MTSSVHRCFNKPAVVELKYSRLFPDLDILYIFRAFVAQRSSQFGQTRCSFALTLFYARSAHLTRPLVHQRLSVRHRVWRRRINTMLRNTPASLLPPPLHKAHVPAPRWSLVEEDALGVGPERRKLIHNS